MKFDDPIAGHLLDDVGLVHDIILRVLVHLRQVCNLRLVFPITPKGKLLLGLRTHAEFCHKHGTLSRTSPCRAWISGEIWNQFVLGKFLFRTSLIQFQRTPEDYGQAPIDVIGIVGY